MAKSKNYSKEEFNLIEKRLKTIEFNSVEAIESIAKELDRKCWSVYTFIQRKFNINLLPDQAARRRFGVLHFSSAYKYKKKKDINQSSIPLKYSKEPKENKKEPYVRPPTQYSNFDIEAWKKSLLKDDPEFNDKN